MSGLPSGYTQLEYIQSSGTQYIDTGIIPTNHVDIAVKFQLTETQSVGGIISAEKTWETSMYSVDAWACRYNTTYKRSAFVENVDYTVRVIGKNFYINDEIYFTGNDGDFNGGLSLTMFAVNRSNTPNEYSKSKIYCCKIYDNGMLVRDFIPCQTTGGAIGLWDDVNSVFYGNAGTGTFTAGPEILPPASPTGLQTVLAVVLQWAASANADRYDVYRDGAKLGSTETTQYVDTTAEPNETYVYTVKAVNGGGESAGTSITVYTKSGYFEYKPLIESANFP